MKTRIDFLDQLRAIAVFPVVIEHYHSDWLPGGGIGVGIFFALSGYLISTILLNTPGTARSTAEFLVRRVFRVYPLLICLVVAAALCRLWIDRGEGIQLFLDIPSILTMSGTPHPELGYSMGVLWTLYVEFAFYFAAAVATFVLGPRAGVTVLVSALLAIGLALVMIKDFGVGVQLPSSPLRYWGIALAFGGIVALNEQRINRALVDRRTTILLLATAALAVIVGLLPIPPVPFARWHEEVLAAAAAASVLIAVHSGSDDLPVIWCLPYFGRISYSIYLVHAFLIDYGRAVLQLSVGADVRTYLAWTVIIASASYFAIEQPGIRLGRRLIEILRTV